MLQFLNILSGHKRNQESCTKLRKKKRIISRGSIFLNELLTHKFLFLKTANISVIQFTNIILTKTHIQTDWTKGQYNPKDIIATRTRNGWRNENAWSLFLITYKDSFFFLSQVAKSMFLSVFEVIGSLFHNSKTFCSILLKIRNHLLFSKQHHRTVG